MNSSQSESFIQNKQPLCICPVPSGHMARVCQLHIFNTKCVLVVSNEAGEVIATAPVSASLMWGSSFLCVFPSLARTNGFKRLTGKTENSSQACFSLPARKISQVVVTGMVSCENCPVSCLELLSLFWSTGQREIAGTLSDTTNTQWEWLHF